MRAGRGHETSSGCWERAILLVLLVAVAWLCGTGAAHAAAGAGAAPAATDATVQIAGAVYDRPSVAVSPTGTAYIGWYTNTQTGSAVHYCVLPLHAAACQSTGELIIGDGMTNIDAVQVLAPDGPTVSILASASGFPDTITEWQSTDGGATWPVVDNGLPVASAGSGDDFPVGGVVLPGLSASPQLGFGWQTVGGPPTFDAFPASSAPACSPLSVCPFATLQPVSEPDQVSNTDGSIAASSEPQVGVLAVYSTQAATGALGCRGDGEGLGFIYGSGLQSPTNSYSVSPGQPGSAWQAPVARAECNLDAPFSTAAGGNLARLGIIATDADDTETFYQPFDPTTRSFGPKVEIIDNHESYPSLTGAADGSNLLVTTFDDSSTDAIEVAASPDAGRTWDKPVALDSSAGDTSPASSIDDSGDGWVAWLNDDTLFAKSFFEDPIGVQTTDPTASASSTATATASTMAVTVHCSSACTITISITLPTAHPASDAHVARRARTAPVILATGTTRLRKPGTRKVTLRLTRSGRTLLDHHHGLNATLMLSVRAGGRTISHTSALHITHLP
jgi:hypothetical protein